jgi:hypothetical protein
MPQKPKLVYKGCGDYFNLVHTVGQQPNHVTHKLLKYSCTKSEHLLGNILQKTFKNTNTT